MKKILLGLMLMFTMNSCYAQKFPEAEPIKDTIVTTRMLVGDMYDSNATLYTKEYRKAYAVDRKEDFVAGKEYIFKLQVHQDGTKVRKAKVIYYSLTPEQVREDIINELGELRELK